MPADILPMTAKNYHDPREQDVEHDETDVLFSVSPGRLNFAGILVDAATAAPGASSDRCSVCGELTALHLDTSGCFWIGCLGASNRRKLGYLDTEKKPDPYLWGDQHPEASVRARAVLQTACYTVSAVFNDLSYDQQTQIARRLAVEIIRAYLAKDGDQ